ncbi:protein phosphatase 2C domain-containing protein [Kitasatospora sp. NPDC056181]|uniref:protein phosphatase 2C domain-containing protein n=1 Tax=Kitasatospora sp. NPDC056181 TaxID=3345737 RepID=UPI0035E24338
MERPITPPWRDTSAGGPARPTTPPPPPYAPGAHTAPNTRTPFPDGPRPDPDRWSPIVVDRAGPVFEPRPPVGRYFRADTESDGWSTDHARLRLASVRGNSHRYYRKPRQDSAAATFHAASETIVFAVADGVSAASLPELGSMLACEAAIGAVLRQLDAGRGEFDWTAVVRQAAAALTVRATAILAGAGPGSGAAPAASSPPPPGHAPAARPAPHPAAVPEPRIAPAPHLAPAPAAHPAPDPAQVERLLATTLVVGTARPVPGGLEVRLSRAGDSGAWVLDLDRAAYRPLFAPKYDPDAVIVSNAVVPLPRCPDPAELGGCLLVAGQVLLVGTDGFGDPLGDGDGQVGALFARELAEPPSAAWLAHVLDFSRQTFDDDRTLIAIWPGAGAGRPA